MKDFMERVLGLLLVLTTTVWAQVVCPMMLFPQSSTSCGTHQPSAPVAVSSQGSQHDCCPRKHHTHASHQQSSTVTLSDVSSMNCCSLERPPATSSKMVQTSPEIAVLGKVIITEANLSDFQRWIEIADSGPPLGVLSLKEDLRI